MSDTNAFGQPVVPPPPPPVQTSLAAETPLLAEHDQAAQFEELLLRSNPPEFLPLPWRYRHRTNLRVLVARMSTLLDEDGKMTVDDTDVEAMAEALSLVADVDEFFETVAIDPKRYAAWSAGLDEPESVLLALLAKYGRAVGESSPSANGSTATASS